MFVVGRDELVDEIVAAPDDVVVVTSDTRHRFTDLDGDGRRHRSRRGRTRGGGGAGPRRSVVSTTRVTPAANAIRSQVVTVEVEDVDRAPRRGRAAGGGHRDPDRGGGRRSLDGTPITVDGASRAGWATPASGSWSASADPEFPGFTVVNSQGRYLLERPDAAAGAALAGPVRGSDRTDDLVRRLQALGFAGLADAAGVAMAAV